MVNIVGDHATTHRQYDAQLQSDIESAARNVSGWVRTSQRTTELSGDAAAAVAAAAGPPGQVATLIVPADVSWSEGAEPAAPVARAAPARTPVEVVDAVAKAVRGGEPTALLLGRTALLEPGLVAAARVAAACGAKLLAETFPTRLAHGAGLPAVERIGYLAETAPSQNRRTSGLCQSSWR